MKKNHKILLLVIVAAIFGGLITALTQDYIATKANEQRIKNEEYKNLANILIEINAGTNSGINKLEWSDRIKQFSIASSKYKISIDPDEEEIALLNEILSQMRQTNSFWAVEIPYLCLAKTPSEDCVRNYAIEVYKLFPNIKVEQEQYITNIKTILKNENKNLSDHKNDLISMHITFTAWSIERFFAYHGVEL